MLWNEVKDGAARLFISDSGDTPLAYRSSLTPAVRSCSSPWLFRSLARSLLFLIPSLAWWRHLLSVLLATFLNYSSPNSCWTVSKSVCWIGSRQASLDVYSRSDHINQGCSEAVLRSCSVAPGDRSQISARVAETDVPRGTALSISIQSGRFRRSGDRASESRVQAAVAFGSGIGNRGYSKWRRREIANSRLARPKTNSAFAL